MKRLVPVVVLLALVSSASAAPLTFDFLWNSSGNAGPAGGFQDFDYTARTPATLTTGPDGRQSLSFSWNGTTWGGIVCLPITGQGQYPEFVAPVPPGVDGEMPGACTIDVVGPPEDPLGFVVAFEGRGSNVGPFVLFEGVGLRTGVGSGSEPTPLPAPTPSALRVALTSPRANATVGGSVAVNVWVDGAGEGQNTFTLAVDGKSIHTQTCACTHVWPSWNTRLHPNGTHTLLASVRDSRGNVGQASLTVIVRN